MVFITSRRTWASASRVFIVVLLIVLAVWAFVHLKHVQNATASAPATQPTGPLAVVPTKAPDPGVAATGAMTAPPAGQQKPVVLPPMAPLPPV
ncbi:MAG TPA: hypothetical protein VF796_05455, partial [Humisphaera sp.]